MEVNDNIPAQSTAGNDGCLQCGTPSYEEGYKVKLCAPCRRKLSRYPISLLSLFFICYSYCSLMHGKILCYRPQRQRREVRQRINDDDHRKGHYPKSERICF